MGKNKKKNRSVAFGRSVLRIGVFILAVLIIALVMSRFIVERVRVVNHSMEHTLDDGESVLIDKISYRFRAPRRFEIIVFRPRGSKEELIKRVIAVPGETIQIKDGCFIIDGNKIKDVKGLKKPEYAGLAESPITLLEGEYFVVGDNREESIDSRYDEVGIVTSTRITGRMFMRVLPLSKMKLF